MKTAIEHSNNYSTVEVKAILYHLNNTISEITMNIPKYTSWGEFVEVAFSQMGSYVEYLTAHWVQISHFDLVTYTHKPNGESVECFLKKTVEIPLDKAYDTNEQEWVSKKEGLSRCRDRCGIPLVE